MRSFKLLFCEMRKLQRTGIKSLVPLGRSTQAEYNSLEVPLCTVIEQPLGTLIPGKHVLFYNCFAVSRAHRSFLSNKECYRHQVGNPKE